MFTFPIVTMLCLDKVNGTFSFLRLYSEYRIAGNFRKRKFSRTREIEHFANNNLFLRISAIGLSYM